MAFGQFGEVEKMKKDKEWLKSEIEKMGLINTGSIFRLIDELDNKAVLSQEWVEEHKYNHYIGRPFVYVDDLQNLLMSKQDKPVIPQFVADCIEYYKRAGDSLGELLAHIEYDDVLKIKLEMLSKVVEWVYPDDFSDNEDRIDLIARAWLDGYTIEKELQWVVKDDTGYLSYLQFSIPDIYELETSLDKNDAYKFNSKSKADLIADLVTGTVKEVTE